MNEKLRNHVNILFAAAPKTAKTEEIKEELLTNLNDKYNDLLADGYDSTAAFHIALSGIGDIDELLKECGAASAGAHRSDGDAVSVAAHRSDGGERVLPVQLEVKPVATPVAPMVFLKPQPSRMPFLLGLAFVLTVLGPGLWFFWTLWGAVGLGFFSLFTCWAIAGGTLIYAIASCFAGGARKAEEHYQRQMLSQGEQHGFSKEFVQKEIRAISRRNKLRQVVLLLVIALLAFFFVSVINNVNVVPVVNRLVDNANQIADSFNNRITPKGPIVKQEREISGDFSLVDIQSAIHVEFKLSDKNLVVVETHEDMMPFIMTEVMNDSLVITRISNRFRNVQRLRVTVYSEHLPQTFFVTGASSLTFNEPIKTESLSFDITGVSTLHLNNLESERLSLRVDGVSTVNITGKAGFVRAVAAGVSKLQMFGLEMDRLDVNLSGTSNANFGNIREDVSIQASGASRLAYRGTPAIKKQEISGTSRVNADGGQLPGGRVFNDIEVRAAEMQHANMAPRFAVGVWFLLLMFLCLAIIIGIIVYAIIRSSKNGKDETFAAPWESATPPTTSVPSLVTMTKEDVSFKRIVAGILAILLGYLGIHKFYLGFVGTGLIMLCITVFSLGILSFVMWTIGFIEGLLYLLKSDRDFYRDYEIRRRNWF